ncbi:superoxide dismutase family protein [Paenibacillus sp. NPDC056579]|uniref:superoxide dismutase family protein n=1 Tax=Paenibacillus sp. NPDC056579 TaxID=3345871 RepID=UPI0036C0D750
MRKLMNRGAVLLSFTLLLTSGCEWRTVATNVMAGHSHPGHQEETAAEGTPSGSADEGRHEPSAVEKTIDMINSKGVKIGTAKLSQVAEGVKFQVDVSGLTAGKHGIHIHQTGVCTPPDFKTAGEHFNPEGKQHGFDNPKGYHAGDLPNLEVGSDGTAVAEFVAPKLTLESGKANSLLQPNGTALVIHEKVDDYKTDPSGNSGNRIACGVIK